MGIGWPLASLGVQVRVDIMHQSPPVQSPSTRQPAEGSHNNDTEQAPLRHTLGPLDESQGPSPTAYPQLKSGSQTPLRHTVGPLPESQGPSPFSSPHLLSCVSHTPLTHTSAAARSVQAPVNGGLV